MQTSGNNSTGLLPLKTVDSILYIDFAHIIWVKAARKHTLVCIKGQQEVIRCILPFSIMEEMLPASYFFKCHRSCIINLMHLKKLDKYNRKIHLTDDQWVIISEILIKEFLLRTNAVILKKS